jgi:hypothetical protein
MSVIEGCTYVADESGLGAAAGLRGNWEDRTGSWSVSGAAGCVLSLGHLGRGRAFHSVCDALRNT